MVIWIIGKSGSGKTFFAKNLRKFLNNATKVKWIDGDKFRAKYSRDLGYTLKDRKENSKRIQKYCRYHEIKGYLIICSILSIFNSHQKQNRNLFSKYIQIYIKSNLKTLSKRNNKNIYKLKKNVVGKDIKFPTPYKSDFVIKNEFDASLLGNIKKIADGINAQI